jgi:hypothetical protein
VHKRQLLYCLLFAGLYSCSKNAATEKDREPPVITLNLPVDAQSYSPGQAIIISGNVTDNKYIKEIHIEVTDLTTAADYLHVHIHPDGASGNFNQTINAQAGISYKIRVIADDASANSSIKQVTVTAN